MLLFLFQAQAASYYFLDSGTRAIGRGGAFVAGADDMSAQYYNPAALSHITRPMVNFNFWGVNQYIEFQRQDIELDGETTGSCVPECDAIYNTSGPMLEPAGGFAMPFGKEGSFFEGSAFAIGLYVPTSPMMAFDPDGAQRYALIDSLVWQIYAGPSVALHTPKVPWLTLGLGLQYTFLRADEALTVSAIFDYDGSAGSNAPSYTDDPANDVTLKLKSWDLFEPSWNAGILIQPVKWLEIGASVQPPISYEAPGSLDVAFNEETPFGPFLESTETRDEEVTLLVKVPWILRAGVQVKPVERLRVEGTFTWTDWSSVEALTITDVDLEIATKDTLLELDDIVVTEDVVIPTGFQDAWSVRLGGDYQVVDWARVSLGAHYESSAVASTRQGVSVVDTPKWGIGAGGTFTIKKRVAIDVAFAEQFLQSRDITDSELRQITLETNPLDPADSVVGEGLVVGNGHFESRLTFLAVGATVFFGETP